LQPKVLVVNPVLKYFDKSIGERMPTWFSDPRLPSARSNNLRYRIRAAWYSGGCGCGCGCATI
jgi:hypothetical protein